MRGPVLRFNLSEARHIYAEIAADAFPELAAVASDKSGEAFVDRLVEVVRQLKLPQGLNEVQILREALPMIRKTDEADAPAR